MTSCGASIRTRPGHGQIAIFNRSHYEDVLVTRVHKLIDKATWTDRYQRHSRLRGPARRERDHDPQILPRISARRNSSPASSSVSTIPRAIGRSARPTIRSASFGTTTSRRSRTRSRRPARRTRPGTLSLRTHKWFRNLAVSQIIANTMAELELAFPRRRLTSLTSGASIMPRPGSEGGGKKACHRSRQRRFP